MGDRAARNATCCEHAASDHDLFGCAVDVSTNSRTYERCHVLVLADALCAAESLWPGVTCQYPPHAGDGHGAKDDRSIYSWSTASVDAARRGDCPGCRQRPCVCSQRCSCGQHDGTR